MKICIIIPNYNHANIQRLLLNLEQFQLPCIVVDDGSSSEIKQELKVATEKFSWVRLISLDFNQGKGAAVLAGLKYAADKGYTHAIQIDADQQHDPSDIPKFLSAVTSNPNALISAQPVYDASVPKSRLYGRKITNFWVMVETLSNKIKDSMCGYRLYPIAKTLKVATEYAISKRMGFDVEIMVRMYWYDADVIFIPVQVTYPEDGVSHFRIWHDNLEISWLHTRLFFGMLKRLPKLLFRKINSNDHWSTAKEKGTLLGMSIVLFCYRFFGKKASHYLQAPR